MLKDVIQTQNMMRDTTEDIKTIESLVSETKSNIDTHIYAIDQLKNKLNTISEKTKDAIIMSDRSKSLLEDN